MKDLPPFEYPGEQVWMVRVMFGTADLIKVTGVSSRQVQYWDSTGLLKSEGEHRRHYGLMELALGLIIVGLRDHTSIQKIRSLVDKVRPLLREEELMRTVVLFVPPGDFVVVHGEVRAALSRGKKAPILLQVGKALATALAPEPS